MILTGHQPNYLPYPGFFHKIAQADIFAIVDDVQFVKRGEFGWQNRNKIRTKDGWIWLTVPVLTKDKYDQSISDTKINNSTPWKRKHLKSIEINYSHTPYYKDYIGFFEELYNKDWENLEDLNNSIIFFIIDQLGIKVDIKTTKDLHIEGKSTDYIINLCKTLGADEYLSGIHGKDYLEEEKFQQNGIKLNYQEFSCPNYSQQFANKKEDFIPNLSMIDLLFNEGKNSKNILL